MTDPSAAIQKAVFAALRDDPDLQAWFAAPAREKPAEAPRIFDRVPVDGQRRMVGPFPYLVLGGDDDQVLDDSDGCHDSAETFVTIHGWSRAVGATEAREMMAHVVRILDAEIPITGHAVISHRVEAVRGAPGQDGLTTHRVATVVFVTSPT